MAVKTSKSQYIFVQNMLQKDILQPPKMLSSITVLAPNIRTALIK